MTAPAPARAHVGNPLLPFDTFVPDGEPHVFGDRVYLFGSHDKEGGERYCELQDYVGWSAPVSDLSAWRYEGVTYRSDQDPRCRPGQGDLYAPDVVRGNDGRYYMYYTLSGPGGEGFNTPISVAVCDTPAGRYEYLGPVSNPDGTLFLTYLTGDPAVINDDGTIRLYYGWSLSSGAAAAHGHSAEEQPARPEDVPREQLLQAEMMLFKRTREELEALPEDVMGANVVELSDDMLTVAGQPHRIVPGEFAAHGTSFEGHAFYEAASIRKIGPTYYFIYSSQLSHELCYATSEHPDQGFRFRGTIISNGDVGFRGRAEEARSNMTGNNHGSIERIDGRWYVFYHRQTHGSTFSRQACAEPIEILPDGSIPQVQCTSSGPAGPLPARGELFAVQACTITDGQMPHATNRVLDVDIPRVTHDDVDRFVTSVRDGVSVGFRNFEFGGPVELAVQTRGSARGQLVVEAAGSVLGAVPVGPSEVWEHSTTRIDADGVSELIFTFRGTGMLDMRSIRLT